MPLTKDEIRSLLSDIENERVERTLSTDNTKKMSEAICSFANDIRNTKKPGYFLIGADDDGNLDGQTFTDEQLRSYAGLRNSGTILPPPAMMVYKESFPEGEVAVIEVQPSEDTPVRYKGVIWIRVGARKAEANTEEERILTEKGQMEELEQAGFCRMDKALISMANTAIDPGSLRKLNKNEDRILLGHGFLECSYRDFCLLTDDEISKSGSHTFDHSLYPPTP